MNTVMDPVRAAKSVVSAESDQRMAMDAMAMAKAQRDRVQQQMMGEATDASWWSWQERMKAADVAVDRAVMRVVDASKAVCRASVAAWSEAA